MFKSLLTLLGLASGASILDFEGITLGESPTVEQEFQNAEILEIAMKNANAPNSTDRQLYIPKGFTYSIMPVHFDQMKNVQFTIDGTLLVSEHWKNFTQTDQVILFTDSDGILVDGKGAIDGRGFMWWVRDIFLGQNECCRPDMIRFRRSRNIEMKDVFITNGPRYQIRISDCENIYMHDFEIYVDVMGQLSLSKFYGGINAKSYEKYGDLSLKIPMFPLNTDAIDTWARNVTFRRLKITNFDDAIVPKPSNQGDVIAKCTENILAEDIESWFTVGMSLGSVPPSTNHACIRNVTFRNIKMEYPIKGIYIKPNPGSTGDGIIENILYENVSMKTPIWWAIWIGPQQQHQPGGSVQGCSMLYPYGTCNTQPRVTMRNFHFKNITSTNSLLPAGVILCNSTNPCTNFTFENVNMRTPVWDALGIGFINHFSEGVAINSFPDPKFKPAGYYNDPKNRVLDADQDVSQWFSADFMFSKLVEIVYGMEYGFDFIETQNQIAAAQKALEIIS